MPGRESGLLARWRRLPAEERFAVIEAAAALVVAVLAVRLASPRRVAGRVARAARAGGPGRLAPGRLGVLVEAVARHVPGATCLPQAVAAAWMLTRRGWRGALVLGAARPDGVFHAHAWLEHDGAVLVGGRAAARHAPLWRRRL